MNTRRTTTLVTLAAISWSLAACSGGGTPPPVAAAEPAPMGEDAGAELVKLMNDLDPVALGNLVTDDARLLPPNIPAVEGREAIVEHYKGVVASQLKYEATQLKSVTISNVGLTEGTYRVKNLAKDAYVEDGKFLAVWVNQSGQWKIARLMVNADYQLARVSVSVEPESAAVAGSAKP